MSRSTADVKNWMNLSRWIVKLIRDEYGIDEAQLVRGATIETDIDLSLEQIEEALDIISQSFNIRFPDSTLDELVRFEDLCLLASWLRGYYKKPDFISPTFEGRCRAINSGAL
jgi:hypothetical protein